jgi:hypothetical protein
MLFTLYEFNWNIDAKKLHATTKKLGDQSYWLDFSYLVGAAFSLWRAAFLTDVHNERPPKQVSDSIHRFLHPLIRDNIINFAQDRESSQWSVGYYLSNANFRLIAVAKRRAGIVGLDDFERVVTPLDLGTHNTNAQDRWEQSFSALQLAAKHVIKKLQIELLSK